MNKLFGATGSISRSTESLFLEKLPFRVEKCIDIGMNHGDYSKMVLGIFPGAEIVGIEPIEEFASECRELLPESVVVLNLALSNGNEDISLYRKGQDANSDPRKPDPHSKQVFQQVTVRTTTIDKLWSSENFGDPDFIKIDTDGYDLRALMGGRELVRRTRPVIQIEVSRYWRQTGSKTSDLDTFCADLGYSMHIMRPSGPQTISSARGLRNGQVTYNLILVPEESSEIFLSAYEKGRNHLKFGKR